MPKILKKPITDYWLKNYVKPYKECILCVLCANTGLLKLHPRIIKEGYAKRGEETYCVCPNGQTIRFIDQKKDLTKRPN